MTLMFFAVRIASIPIFWFKVYSICDSPLWIKMRHFRYIMIVTCLALDVINIYWFRKMFKGALIVWSTNWQYYEKHHKTQQLEMLYSYRNQLKEKIIHSTMNGLSAINPGRYLNVDFIERTVSLPRVLSDFLHQNRTNLNQMGQPDQDDSMHY